ncbi:type I polyketide synthase [Nocardia sp. alder85J]|uniref:type I polyketide synthase n=1 Tax=Nocardia sp. alder85J TaxID=2862949 RepID=UPI001CD80E20|nr:type I polyketide synthase [Nocardia sp. alder85J]MCX4092551.1 type I polyketide synthase [Nocardia sp. alder85J]
MAVSVDDYLVGPPELADRTRHRTLADVFAAAVDRSGDSTAVLDGVTSYSWTRWRDESRALAAGLAQLGVGLGDVVAVQLPNSWEFLLTHVAVAELGAVMMPVHAAYGDRDLLALLRRAEARALVRPAGRALSAEVIAAVRQVVVVGDTEARGVVSFAALLHDFRGRGPAPVPLHPELPFVVLPSSGTVSGRPKLCLHSHGTLLSNAAAVARDGAASGADILVSAGPFTHLFGLLSIHLSLLTGGRQALLRGWDAAAFHRLAQRSGATVLFAVPTQLRDVVTGLADPDTGPLRLREVRTGGAAVPGSLVADIRQRTGATTIVQWGMSELGAGTVTRPDDPPHVATGSIGRPLTGSSVRVVDASGAPCPVGATGELQYRGPHMFRGYLGDPAGTAAALTADGWLRTGDLASIHPDGTVAYRGRDAEVINVGGVKFAASDIESLLSDLPQVATAAIAAKPDPRLGQYPCLIVATRPGHTLDLATVRAHLLAKGAAEYQLPLELLLVDTVPVTPTGKVARGRLAQVLAGAAARPARPHPWASGPPADRVRAAAALVRECVAALVPAAEFGGRRPFRDLGVDSLRAVRLAVALSEATGLPVSTTVAFDHPDPDTLARHLVDLAAAQPRTAGPGGAAGEGSAADGDPVVIVGMACRLPGGIASPEQLWRLLVAGGETVGPFPADRGWDLARLTDPDPATPGRSAAGAGHFLTAAAEFDARFFGISPREAAAMDPQQRLLLETGWEALERAGIDPSALRGSDTGVFVGQMASDYAPRVFEAPEQFDGLVLTGNSGAVAAGRISYTLGLNGPALAVDTACSSSLVALHLAAQSLRRGECGSAVVAGTTVMATPASFVDFTRQGAMAADGRCKAFGPGADGAAWGEGVVTLVLERLSRAVAAGHPVLAVVAGSAVNSDGASNGLTAPNGQAQQRVLRAALADAGVGAEGVDVVEAHGTGTPLGDRIEAEALAAVYGGADAGGPLRVGSAKSNVGHTQAAAGLVGVVKTVLALRHSVLPATLHTGPERPGLPSGPGRGLRLVQAAEAWPGTGRVRRAGVSAFGIGGTNAHVILAEPPAVAAEPVPTPDGVAVPWVLSARDSNALRELAARLVPVAGDRGAVGRALVGARAEFDRRAVVVARDRAELLAGLGEVSGVAVSPHAVVGVARPDVRPVFVFPGQGSQWERMGAELLAESPVFARAVDACDRALAPHVDWSVRAVLEGASGAPSLDRVEVAQTSLFAVMIGLAEVWEALGVRPAAVIGHSQGEIAAAVVCGALSLDDAAALVARRAAAVARLAGAMAAVALSAGELAGLLSDDRGALSVAADNGPHATVVSGPAAAVTELVASLVERGVRATVLPVDYASHCAEVASIEPELTRELGTLAPRSASVPFYSSVVAGPLDTAELTASYWYRNLRHRVEFRRAVECLLAAGYTDFVEVSPHPVLTQSILDTAGTAGHTVTAVGTLHRGAGDLQRMLLSAAEAYVHGTPVDWSALFAGQSGPHVELPTYPFQRQRYWLDHPSGRPAAAGIDSSSGTAVLRSPPRSVRTQPPSARGDSLPGPAAPTEAESVESVRRHAAVVLGYADVAEVGPDDAFTALGASSLAAVELRGRLSRAFDVALPASVVFDHGTPRALGTHLHRLLGVVAPPVASDGLGALVRQACRDGRAEVALDLMAVASRLRPTFDADSAAAQATTPVRLGGSGGDHTLVCFPSVLPGGGPHEYAGLAAAFGDAYTVLALPQPGFATPGPLPADMAALAAAHAVALTRDPGSSPLVLCGHSAGGVVAHAVAERLEESGRPAAGLVLLDSYWPDRVLHADLLPLVLARVLADGGFDPGMDRLTAAGGYLRVLAAGRPPAVRTPTLVLTAREPIPGADAIVPTRWQLPHTAVAVPGDHFTMLSAHAPALAAAIDQWWSAVVAERRPTADQGATDRP